MILVDVSQTIISNIAMMPYSRQTAGVTINGGLIKHLILNSLRSYNKKFKNEYGPMVICVDSHSWRKEAFAHYKAKRTQSKEAGESPIDWNMVYQTMKEMIAELKEFFPYKVIQVYGAEADDIIATLERRIASEGKHLIISADKDLSQLIGPGVKQYNPIKKQFIEIDNPKAHLKELLIRGDEGDGVPNFLSDDDTFVNENKRQKPISSKKLEGWLHQEPEMFCENKLILNNYRRNELLIDLSKTPEDIQDKIIEEYKKPAKGSGQSVQTYLMNNKMRNLLEDLQDFV